MHITEGGMLFTHFDGITQSILLYLGLQMITNHKYSIVTQLLTEQNKTIKLQEAHTIVDDTSVSTHWSIADTLY